MGRDNITFFRSTYDKPFYFSMVGTTCCDGNYHIHRNASFETVIEFIVSGTGTLKVNDSVYYPSAGQVYILRQKSMHDYFSDSADPWVKLFFNIRGPLVEHLLDAYGLEGAVVVNGEGLEQNFRDILNIAQDTSLSHDEIFTRCAPEIHKLIISLAEKNVKKSVDLEMKRVVDYIAKHYDRLVPNRELAQEIFRSEDYVIKRFKNAYGVTPYEYQINEKINGAKALLKNTNLPVGKIANQFGYADQRYFANLFRKRCGISPSEYRKMHFS